MPRLLIAASGTGGHIFPALAVAEALPNSWNIFWLGVPDRLESKVVPKKYPITSIRVSALQARGIRKIFQIIKLLFSTVDVIRLIRRKKIEIVFTTGGYIAAPSIIGSKLCGIPVVLHESNAFPGKVTRFFGRLCDQVALGLPNAVENLHGCRTVFTGTPVRNSFLVNNDLPSWVPNGRGPLVVVMGGSQGAIGLNRMVIEIVPWLLNEGCRLVHITGRHDKTSFPKVENYVDQPFTVDIPGLLQHADLVISRAGASALSELAVCNTPTIFIPFPYAADNHQDCNASYAARFGAALIVHEDLSGEKTLRRVIKPLIQKDSSTLPSDGLLNNMRQGMKKIAVQDAHLRLVDILKIYSQ